SDEYIRGFKRIWVKIRTKKFPEPNNLSDRPITPSHSLVFFDGEGNHFSDLYEWRAFIHDKLRSEAHPKCLSVSEANTAPIALHVRYGDGFRDAISTLDYYTQGAIRTPITWFSASLRCVRQVAGWLVPAVVESNGARKELDELLRLPNVSLSRSGNPLCDLLMLGRSTLLVGSGGSSFSAWGAFLRRERTITHPARL